MKGRKVEAEHMALSTITSKMHMLVVIFNAVYCCNPFRVIMDCISSRLHSQQLYIYT